MTYLHQSIVRACFILSFVLGIQTMYAQSTDTTPFIFSSSFSPDFDGDNDFFHIEGLNTQLQNSLTVFDHSGKLVYFTDSYRNDWFGKDIEGHALPANVEPYFFVLEDEDGGNWSGYVQIIY